MGMMGSVFLIPIFAQTFLDLSATQVGYLFIPLAFLMVGSASVGARYASNIQPRFILFGSTFLAGAGIYLFAIMLDPRSGVLDVVIPLSLLAVGMGFAMSHRTNLITAVVSNEEIGSASSVLALARNIAGAFGIAISATILKKTMELNLAAISKQSSFNSTNPFLYKKFISLAILKSQITAYHTVFLISSIVIIIGAIASLWIVIPKERLATTDKIFVE
jgi:DHA2 family multidrug resistance protein